MSTSPHDDYVLLDMEDAEGLGRSIVRPQSPKTLAKIHGWLQPTAYDDGTSEYLRHLRSHVRGTGNWLSDTDEYQKWHSSDSHNVLWIRAVPGAGKSVLAAQQRARISSTETAPVLHFFFRQIITANREPKQLVRDWLTQLLPHSLKLQQRIKKEFLDRSVELDAVAFQDLWDMLWTTLQELPRVYCFADALDEMSVGHEDFLLELTKLGQLENCRVFLTSRPVPRIVEILRKQPLVQITLGPENMSEDISIYVDHRLNRDIDRYVQHRLNNSGIDLGTEETRSVVEPLVRSTLQSKAQGSFLYARLMMDNVLQAISNIGGDINAVWMQRVLDGLPTGLADMYGDMLRDHADRSGTPRKLQRIILQWVTHSERPLRMLELAAIVDFESGTLERNKDTKAVVRTGCGPLIEILPSDVVGPVHHSFTEFLTNESRISDMPERHFPCFESKSTHRDIAKRCIEYILHVFQDAPRLPLSALKVRLPFLSYALTCWPAHVSKCGDLDDEMILLLDRLVVDNKDTGRIWMGNNYSTGHPGDEYFDDNSEDEFEPRKLDTTPMHIAASVGIGAYISRLRALGYDIHALDERGNTPVHLAAENGNAKCLEVLLEAGAEAGVNDNIGLTPLLKAVWKGHSEATAVLLRHGVDPLTPKGAGEYQRLRGDGYKSDATAVKYVAKAGNVKTMEVLLEYLKPEGMLEATYFAFEQSRTDLVATIIASPRFEINRVCRGMTPIFMAAANHDGRLIRMLLKAGASATIPSRSNFRYESFQGPHVREGMETPLHAYTKNRRARHDEDSGTPSTDECKAVVKLLIDAGCKLEARDALGNTALQNAQSNYSMTSALLANGADPKTVVQNGDSPLHKIAGRDQELMKLWISYGLNINDRNTEGLTPLHVAMGNRRHRIPIRGASSQNRSEAIKALLALGADPNIADRKGKTPLHQALLISVDKADEINVKVLLDAGANVHARDGRGRTPLMACTELGICTGGRLLLNAGAHIEARDCKGETWLMKRLLDLSGHGFEAAFDLQIGLNFLATDRHGANLIHLYVAGHTEIEPLEKLLNLGIDPKAVDTSGNTTLHYSVGSSGRSYLNRRQLIERLLDLGVQPTKTNYMGQSISLLAAALGYDAVESLENAYKYSFNINEADIRGLVPLHLVAAISGRDTLLLLRKGADPLKKTHCGRSALHSAALAANSEVLSILLSWGSSQKTTLLNAQDRDGLTALHYAARSGCPESVRLLLQAGADPNILDHKKRSALFACASFPAEVKRRTDYRENSRHDFNIRHLLEEDWEEIVRLISLRHNNDANATNLSNVRQCVRYLVSAGVDLYLSDRRGTPISNKWSMEPQKELAEGQRIEHVLDEALRSKCEPFIYEVMSAMQSNDKKTGDERTASRSFDLSLDLWMYEKKREHLDFLIDTTKEGKERKELMHNLCSDDSAEQMARMCGKGYNFQAVDDDDDDESDFGDVYYEHRPLLDELVREARHEAIHLLRPVLGNQKHSQLLPSHENWINLCVIDGLGSRHHEELKTTREALSQPFDGLLFMACESKQPNAQMLRTIISDYGCSNHEMMSVLFILANEGKWWHLEAMEILLDQGLDVNFQNPYGTTPLMMACHSFRTTYKAEVVKLLLKRGADPNIADDENRTCLAGASGDRLAVEALLSHGADIHIGCHRLILNSVQERDVEMIQTLINEGVDFNQLGSVLDIELPPDADKFEIKQAESKSTYPIHYALCRSSRPPVYQGGMNAEEEKYKRVLETLVRGGANVSCITRDGIPIMHDVLENSEAAMFLLDMPGLELEKRDIQGRTLLLAGASKTSPHHSLQVVRRLIELGCDVTATDLSNRNLLHILLSHKYQYRYGQILEKASGTLEKQWRDLFQNDLVKNLISAGESSGHTPVDRALATQPWPVVEVLLEHGASITAPDPCGENAFHHIFKDIWRAFYGEDDSSAEEIEDGELATRLMNERKQSFLRAIKLCKSAGNDVNALSSGPCGEPPVFGYLRCHPFRVFSSRYHLYRGGFRLKNDFANVLKMLVEDVGVDLKTKARNGQGALHVLATRLIHDKYAEEDREGKETLFAAWNYLVDAGLDPFTEDNEQRSALDIAAALGNTAIMELYSGTTQST